jgi:hypothetical protein
VRQRPHAKKSFKAGNDISRAYNVSMKTSSAHRNTLGGLINARLAEIGASNIPDAAKTIIEADVWQACQRVVERSVTAPRVGRAVARALAAPAAEQGCKGGTPLPSSESARNAQTHVAGRVADSPIIQPADTINEADHLPKGEGA